jgi:hypothetical protein
MKADLLAFMFTKITLGLAMVLGLGDDTISIASTFLTLDELRDLLQQRPANYIVDGFLPADDVHVAVGDSGLGKTAWAYQLGLCVATGVPFLGMNVQQGRVLYVDMENGREEILNVSQSLCTHLGIEPFPGDFLCGEGCDKDSLFAAVAQFRPSLVIIDTLRPFDPQAEKYNDEMGKFLQELKTTAREQHCAFLLLHHIRKPGENGVPALENTNTLEWLLQAAGARALINQTNTRIAFDRPRRAQPDSAFVMKTYVKLKGESGPVYIERVCDGEGEPIGYQRIVGVDLLGNYEQQAALMRLPEHFTFKEAKQIYARSDDPTRKWLLKCESAGLVNQTGRGQYSRMKLEPRADRECF